MTAADTATAVAPPSPGATVLVRRHSGVVRITHWINVFALFFLLQSGLQIFNATPALYVGQYADFDHPVLSLTAQNTPNGPIGVTQIGPAHFDTTGFLGLSKYEGDWAARGFPSWLTIPGYQDLATGRRWHFLFAWLFAINGGVYLLSGLASGHLWRDLVPTDRDLKNLGASIVEHVQLHFAHVREYNVLQKLAYLGVVLVMMLLVVAGMAMSPGLDSAFPFLIDIFGGRQTARTVHFICAMLIVLFFVVHIVMVLISGLWNNLRSMITGRYAVEAGSETDAH